MKRTISILMAAVMCLSLGACGKENEEEKSSSEKYIYDEKFANSDGLYVAGDTMYDWVVHAAGMSLYVVDGERKKEDVIDWSRSALYVQAVTDDCIYYTKAGEKIEDEESGTFRTPVYLYKYENGADEPECLYEVEFFQYMFFDGEYIYSVDSSGTIIRNINSKEKYKDSREIIHEDDVSVETPILAKFYKGCIYYSEKGSDILIEVDIKDGSSRKIKIDGVLGPEWCFYKDNIVCWVNDGTIRKIPINGGKSVEYDKYKFEPYKLDIANKYVYTIVNEKMIRIDLTKEGDDAYSEIENEKMISNPSPYQALEGKVSTIIGDTGLGIVCEKEGKYFFFDYDGNPIK